MTNSSKDDDVLADEEIERLLRSVVDEGTQAFPGRARLRERILEELESPPADRVRPRSTGVSHLNARGPEDGLLEADLSDEDLADVFIFDVGEERSEGRLRDSRWLLAAAALLVCCGIGGFALLNSEGGGANVEAVSDDESSLIAEGEELPAPIAQGEHRSNEVAGGIRLELPAGIEVLQEQPGLIVLGWVGDEVEPRAVITIVEPEGDRSLEAAVADLEADGLINPFRAMGRSSQGLVDEWEVRLTNQAAERFECEAVGPCLPLGELEMWSRSMNFVVELIGPDGERVWWVEQTSRVGDPLIESGPAILESLRFD